jgi:FtsP/CotA-like multicopper oxidase with cupredoxin domain
MRFMLDRRAFLGACGLSAASRLLPACSSDAGDEAITPPPDGSDAGTFVVPPLLEGDIVDGVRVFRLDLRPGQVEWLTGAPTATYGVNGNYLGPTLHFHRGERVRIEVTNSLAETTTLHWHGMQVPSRSDGGPYQTIVAGAMWAAEYDVNQRALTAWYHPHQMHETARHVYMGMAGMIITEDDGDTASLPHSYGIDDLPVVIQDRHFFADGTHPYSAGKTLTMRDMMAGVRGETMLINGVRTPRRVVPRGLVRLRLLNGSNARIYNVGVSDNRSFLHIASDGGLLDAPLTTSRVLLAPGERAEILVDFGADAAGAQVRLQSFSGEVFSSLYTGAMGANLTDALDRTTFDLMTFEAGSETSSSVTPTSFEPIVRTPEGTAVRTRPIAFAMAMGSFTINGATMTGLGSAVPAAINYQIKNGDTEIWSVTNTSGVSHPLHLHNRHFQILDIDGAPPPPALAGWKDTTIIAPGRTLRLIVGFDGTPDVEFPYMFHCHILEHEDMGMMGQFYIVP